MRGLRASVARRIRDGRIVVVGEWVGVYVVGRGVRGGFVCMTGRGSVVQSWMVGESRGRC